MEKKHTPTQPKQIKTSNPKLNTPKKKAPFKSQYIFLFN